MPVSENKDWVFINCPFDDDYQELFRAILFTIYSCGFVPRCAFQEDDGSNTRIEKLYSIRIV